MKTLNSFPPNFYVFSLRVISAHPKSAIVLRR